MLEPHQQCEKLEQQRLTNTARLSAIGEMAAAITHEINNPLGVILGRAEMLKARLKDHPLDLNTLQKYIETIETNALRIDKIIQSMRCISHQEQPNEKFETEFIQKIVEQTLDLCAERFKNNNYDLKVILPPTLLTLQCHPTQIFQVLLNLLNNAFDATLKFEKKWVELAVTDEENQLKITVTDCGTGIPSHLQPELFKPFFSTKPAKYGTGLGLSISKGLVEKHHGVIYYDETFPNTRFVVQLPKKQLKT